MQSYDFVVIGAGIAGASAAFALAPHGRVLVLEAESQPGYHATGRSAAQFHLAYGGPALQTLSQASLGFFNAPPEGFAEAPLLEPRDILVIARPDQTERLHDHALDAPGAYTAVSQDAAEALWPALRPGYAAAALLDRTGADIEVGALHQGFLRLARRRGAAIETDRRVTAIARDGAAWRVGTATDTVSCAWVLNAAGAWGDRVAALAGVRPIGLQPKRRTAALIDAPPESARWPMLIDAAESFYAKPSGGRMLISPAEETDVEPHDAAADDEALAYAIERLEQATTLTVRRKPTAWAGLRSFAPDRRPVIGAAPEAEGFFWLVGQGGYGVQTSPAAGELAASLIAGSALPAALAEAGVDPSLYRPDRF